MKHSEKEIKFYTSAKSERNVQEPVLQLVSQRFCYSPTLNLKFLIKLIQKRFETGYKTRPCKLLFTISQTCHAGKKHLFKSVVLYRTVQGGAIDFNMPVRQTGSSIWYLYFKI